MKFILEEGDKAFIENHDHAFEGHHISKLFEKGEVYSFSFKVDDVAKADNFFFSIFPNYTGKTREFEDATGIAITSLNMKGLCATDIKDEIDEIIDTLTKLKNRL